MGLDFGNLAARVGGTVKEAGRNALTNGLLNAVGLGAMSGQVNYAEYEYDANGHIKGVSSKYQAAVEDKYQGQSGIDLNSYNAIDGNTGGLTTGTSRFIQKDNFIPKYPIKFNDPSGNIASYKNQIYYSSDEVKKEYDDAINKYDSMANDSQQDAISRGIYKGMAKAKKREYEREYANSQKSLQGMLYNDSRGIIPAIHSKTASLSR